jgi:hypothetical protein
MKRYSVRKYLGLYQAWFLTLYSSRRFRRETYTIESFFNFYPTKKFLTQFTENDIDDYIIMRKRSGRAAATQEFDLHRIRHFWNWATQEQKLVLLDPLQRTLKRLKAQIPKRDGHKKALSLNELRVIYEKLDEESRKFILYRLTVDVPVPYSVLKKFKNASKASGWDYRWGDFIFSLPKFRLSILQNLNGQLRDALFPEPKSDSSTFGNIQVPAFDEGTAICDMQNEGALVQRIEESQFGSKWESPMCGC